MSPSFTEISPGGQLGWARCSLRSRICWRRGGYFGIWALLLSGLPMLSTNQRSLSPSGIWGWAAPCPHGPECAFRQGGSNILTVAQVTENAIRIEHMKEAVCA